jgi:hypothetical protein
VDSNYLFHCVVMWCRFGQPDAGGKLLRAADSRNPDCGECLRRIMAIPQTGEGHVLYG